MFYRFARLLLRILFKLLYRFEAVGAGQVPEHGGVILASNHKSLLDPIALGIGVDRKVHYMAKAELFRIPGFGAMITNLGAFPVKRGGVSKEAIKTAIGILREGNVMGIFPEGTRRDVGLMGKRGAVSMAFRAGAAIVPVALIGSYRPFTKMKAVYGAPLELSALAAEGSAESQEAATELLMGRIREMLNTGKPAQ
ncbi:lysophospholipid acyltransferase family protein [Cohnella sp. 56]|uniref:lysophospholipid acyltransferase family protein n=1 Tax=Cohnella sp. 56 TaxID=3113722 RepID=UPI0030EAE61C